ncbi:MAG: hypothetical protein H6835_16670 [Planctomycetes bacterium]|nr:hypothetical protein [Planctomycetota bacterium]
MMHANEELWISRVVDRRAGDDDWRELDAIATQDPEVWRRLATTLRCEHALQRGVAAVLPPVADELLVPPALRMPRWLVVAAALLVMAAMFVLGRVSADRTKTAPVLATPDCDVLLDTYLAAGRDSGRVLEQLPLQIVESRRREAGEGYEVLFVRSFVERTAVERAMTLAPDELGRPVPLAVDLAHFVPPTDY